MRTKEWLVKQRAKLGYTQKALATEVGVSYFTIANIERGERLGSIETWEKIENYISKLNSDEIEPNISYDAEYMIDELIKDIKEFGEDEKCVLIYRIIDDNIVFTNYDFIIEYDPEFPNEKPWTEDELDEDENYIETTMKYALDVFISQDKVMQKKRGSN